MYNNQDRSSNKKPVIFHGITFAGSNDQDAAVFQSASTYITIPNDGTYAVSSFTWSAFYKPYTTSVAPLWQWSIPPTWYGTHIWYDEGDNGNLFFRLVLYYITPLLLRFLWNTLQCTCCKLKIVYYVSPVDRVQIGCLPKSILGLYPILWQVSHYILPYTPLPYEAY